MRVSLEDSTITSSQIVHNPDNSGIVDATTTSKYPYFSYIMNEAARRVRHGINLNWILAVLDKIHKEQQYHYVQNLLKVK